MNPPRYGWSFTERCVSVQCEQCAVAAVLIPELALALVREHEGHRGFVVIPPSAVAANTDDGTG